MVDRRASAYAGLRSASLGQTPDKENHDQTISMRCRQILPFSRREAASFNQPAAANPAIASGLQAGRHWNQPAAANPAIASGLQAGRHWRGVADPERSA